MAASIFVQGAMRVVTTFAARVGSADRQFVQGAELVVTSLTRSVTFHLRGTHCGPGGETPPLRILSGQRRNIDHHCRGRVSRPAGMAGFIFVQGAMRVVTTFAAR